MSECKHCSHRFLVYDISISFQNQDGVDVFLAGTRFIDNTVGGQLDIQNHNRDVIQTALIEKRKHPQSLLMPSLIDLP
jgi:hypothetical protein